jgi:hypothetical protein
LIAQTFAIASHLMSDGICRQVNRSRQCEGVR